MESRRDSKFRPEAETADGRIEDSSAAPPDEDVWEFIHAYNIPYCKLYDTGCTRLGCVGCPMAGYAAQRRELKRWPQYRKLYVSAFDDMLEARRRDGKLNHSSLWQSGEGVMQ